MTKFTQKQLREMVNSGNAHSLNNATCETRRKFSANGDYLEQIGYASGVYGCSGKLLQSLKTGDLFAIVGNVSALYVF